MSDYEINVIFSICLSVTLLALGAEFYRLVNSIVKELKNNRDRAVNWPRTLSSRCGFLLQVESCFLVSLLEGVNLLYSLNDVAYGQVVYISKTAQPGLVLPCFLIVAVFIFALCQVGCLRASRALSRFRSERELKSALDFAVWLNFSDLVQLLLLYFGLEKFNRVPSCRQLATVFLLTLHVFIELCYDLHFLARQLHGLPKDLRVLCSLITVSSGCLAFVHTTRFGLAFAKFFTIDEFSSVVSTSCQNESALSCLFWFDKFLLVFTFLDLLSIVVILAKMKKMDLSPKLLNPVVYFGPSIPLGTVLLREDENEYPAMMSLELEEARAQHSRPGHDYFELAYECCQKNEPKLMREILEKNSNELNVEALLKCAAQWTAADVIDVLYPKMPRSQDRVDSLPPVAYLGLKNQNAPSSSFKRVLLRFRSYFAEPLDEDGNQLLHLFAVTNRIKPAAMLLELDPSLVRALNYMGLSALDLVPQENIDMRILLLNCGAVHTIHGIARLGNIAAAEDIIHADKSAVYNLNSFGESACHVAAIFGQTKMIQLLIHRGANINHRNDDGWTPLDEAHACGKLDTAKLLLSHGASDRKIKRSCGSKSQFTRSGTL